ncbi:MAG: DUF6090 family protein [Aureibaculum sp.]|nr:DUF6090 family protein [Aureibaculum sp.]
MIPFFRKIRKQYADDNKPLKYMRYAIGEIVLVVIGILIAIQVNNLNEKRKTEKQFKVTLDRLYTSIKVERDMLYYYQNSFKDQLTMIDEILENSDNTESQLLMNMLCYIETDPNAYSSETSFHLSNLRFDPNNKIHITIAKRIATFVNNEWWNEFLSSSNKARKNLIEPILRDSEIIFVPTTFGFGPSPSGEDPRYTHIFSKKDIEDVRNLIYSRKFQNALNTLRLNKTSLSGSLIIFFGERESILSDIKKYYPQVQLLYENIGIVGNALESGWSESVPMTLINKKEAVWEIKIHLSKGRFKFRANDSWSQNWGENSYSPGSLQMNGKDIQVEEGFYHIRINLTENHYFVKRL